MVYKVKLSSLKLCPTPSINQSSLFLSFLPSFFFLHLLDNKNKLRKYWLPRITDKLMMIGSQFIHMFSTSLGPHTL